MQVGVGIFQHAIEVFQTFAQFARPIAIGNIIKDGFIVLVDQHYYALTVNTMRLLNQASKVVRNTLRRRRRNLQTCTLLLQLISNVRI